MPPEIAQNEFFCLIPNKNRNGREKLEPQTCCEILEVTPKDPRKLNRWALFIASESVGHKEKLETFYI